MIFKTFEIPIWNGKQNSLTGPVITGSFEKRAPGVRFSKPPETFRAFFECHIFLRILKTRTFPDMKFETNLPFCILKS